MKASLYSAFSPFGKILEISMHKARRLRSQAWITIDSVAEASNALRTMHGTQLFDTPMEIQFSKDTADIIARREGIFVPREKHKRHVLEIPTTMENDSEDENTIWKIIQKM
jgi:RNA recognition motif-containing protein